MEEFWNYFFKQRDENGCQTLGPLSAYAFRVQPRGLLFQLARYKFCAKMLSGKKSVLEIGCGDGVGVPIMLQCVESLTCLDMNEKIVEDDKHRFGYEPRVNFIHKKVCDSNKLYNGGGYRHDACFSLDVIEHIPHEDEQSFMREIVSSLDKDAVCIFGTPNITAFEYANEINKREHINMQSHESLRNLFESYFRNTFIFSMNDEVVHTGFYPMAHYLFAVGVCLR